jgi:hypothetical protein
VSCLRSSRTKAGDRIEDFVGGYERDEGYGVSAVVLDKPVNGGFQKGSPQRLPFLPSPLIERASRRSSGFFYSCRLVSMAW